MARKILNLKTNSVSHNDNAIHSALLDYFKSRFANVKTVGSTKQTLQTLRHEIANELFDLMDDDMAKEFQRILHGLNMTADTFQDFFSEMSSLLPVMNNAIVENGTVNYDRIILSNTFAKNFINGNLNKSLSDPGQYLTLIPDYSFLGGSDALKDFEGLVPRSFKRLGYQAGDEVMINVFPTESQSRMVPIKIKGFLDYEGGVSLNTHTVKLLTDDFDGDGARIFYRAVKAKNVPGKRWNSDLVEYSRAASKRPLFNIKTSTEVNDFFGKYSNDSKFTSLIDNVLSEEGNYADKLEKVLIDEYGKDEGQKMFYEIYEFIDSEIDDE